LTATKPRKNILSLDSAVASGSVALICGETGSIIKREGSDCSRAEKLISVISDILNEAALELKDLDLIAVSTGPGSYSGIRIGLATALGLSNSLGIQCVGFSVLEAMAYGARLPSSYIAAIPVGKNDVAWQAFNADNPGREDPRTYAELVPLASFVEHLKSRQHMRLFAQTDLLKRLGNQIPSTTPFVDAGIGMAEFVGRLASREDATNSSLQPIYLRNRDAIRLPGF